MSTGSKIAVGVAVGVAVVYFGGRYLVKTLCEGIATAAVNGLAHAAVNSIDEVAGATATAVGEAHAEANKARDSKA